MKGGISLKAVLLMVIAVLFALTLMAVMAQQIPQVATQALQNVN